VTSDPAATPDTIPTPEPAYPWPAGAATGVGSFPGTDLAEALRTVLGEVPDLAFLPELPDRGPGAELIGRGAAFLVDLPVQLAVSGWRFADRPGRDLRRARDLLEWDLDALGEAAEGYEGVLKVQAAGPWTLAAGIELPHGEKALSDHGAVDDLATSLAEGLAAHVAEVRRRVPGARVVLQLDEPSLPAVLAARVPTASGLRTLRRVEESVATPALARVIDAAGVPVIVHSCARDVPLELLRRAGATGVSVDLSQWNLTGARDLDALGEHLDAGGALFAGVLPAVDADLPDAGRVGEPVRQLWQRLGFPAEQVRQQVVLTPACGLAGATPRYAQEVLARLREGATRLSEDPEG
jgi:methionine synthase II (cobalamin-independent)